jgi:hypothetical protein
MFKDLHAAAAKSGGSFGYWGGNNFLDLHFPFQGPIREAFPEVKHLPWDEQYRQLLDRADWGSLRDMSFRFANLAESFAARCCEFGMAHVLIPSACACIHGYLPITGCPQSRPTPRRLPSPSFPNPTAGPDCTRAAP